MPRAEGQYIGYANNKHVWNRRASQIPKTNSGRNRERKQEKTHHVKMWMDKKKEKRKRQSERTKGMSCRKLKMGDDKHKGIKKNKE